MSYDNETLISIYMIIGLIFSILVHMYDEEIYDEYTIQRPSIRILLFFWTGLMWLPSLIFRYLLAPSFWFGVRNFFRGEKSGKQ